MSRVIAALKGEISDNRLMGRLDMLFADVDSNGELQGWVVADLKTGRVQNEELNRRLATIIALQRHSSSNNPNALPVKTEGLATKCNQVYRNRRFGNGRCSQKFRGNTT